MGGTFNTCWKEVSTEPTAQEQGGVRPGAVGLFCYDEKSPPDGTAHAGSTRRRNEGKEKCLSETSARCPNPMTQCQKLPFRDQKKSLCQTHWPGFPLPAVKAPPPPLPAARWLTGPRQVPSVRERLTFALHARGGCLVVPFRIWRKARLVLSPDVGQMFRFHFSQRLFIESSWPALSFKISRVTSPE